MKTEHFSEAKPHLLHVLSDIQQRNRYIAHEDILNVAEQLKLPIAQVQSVVDFYAFFHRTPRGEFDLMFSNCTSCGDVSLMQTMCKLLGVEIGKTRDDGLVSIRDTSCIGLCDQGPALLVNGHAMTRLDNQRLEAMAAMITQHLPLNDWPSVWFTVEENVCKRGLLLNESFAAGDGIRAALNRGADDTLEQIISSGLRGRGGAGFSTGLKWKFCRKAEGDAHYIICNADEGEPGTFKDRMLLSQHAGAVIEGMTIAGYVTGAQMGFIYLRGEYRYLETALKQTLNQHRTEGLLGIGILGQQGFDFDIEIIMGAGAYICGEESSLIESLEEKSGIPRIRPPFPVVSGYLGQPTVVNNVETLLSAAYITAKGEAWFSEHGTKSSAGSKLLSVSGDCLRPGIYEYDFGISMQHILDDCGASDVQAIQVGGPSGTLISPEEFEQVLGFEALATGGSFMIYHQSRDLLAVVQNFAHFFAHENCGFCTPCRVGTSVLRNAIDKIVSGHGTAYDVDEILRLAKLVKKRSHCGLGQTAPNPILDFLEKFPQLLTDRLLNQDFEPGFDLDASLAEARKLTNRDDAGAHL